MDEAKFTRIEERVRRRAGEKRLRATPKLATARETGILGK
jgi:hypothetical protein